MAYPRSPNDDPVRAVVAAIERCSIMLSAPELAGEREWMSGIVGQFTGLTGERVSEIRLEHSCQSDRRLAWIGFDLMLAASARPK